MTWSSDAKRLGLGADPAPSPIDTGGALYWRTSEFNYWKWDGYAFAYVRCPLLEFVRMTR